MQTKINATFDSRNFFVSLISLVLLVFNLNGFDIGVSGGEVFEVFNGGNIGAIVALLITNFLNPVLKLLTKTQQWSWDFLKSMNFRIQSLTVLLMIPVGLGIAFPDGAAAQLIETLFAWISGNGQFEAFAIALVINIINPLYHFFFDNDNGGEEQELINNTSAEGV